MACNRVPLRRPLAQRVFGAGGFAGVRTRHTRAPEWQAAQEHALPSLAQAGVCPAFEREYIRKDGSRIPILFAAVEPGTTPESRLCFVVNLTEHRSLENQVRQTQKLEGVEERAAGIAHDINNLLAVIMGHGQMALTRADAGNEIRAALERIVAAADRASDLTCQLLTPSCRNAGVPRDITLDAVVSGMDTMIRDIAGESIEMFCTSGADAGLVHAEPGLVEQVVADLVTNAREAMPEGGTNFIETGRLNICNEFASQTLAVPEGHYLSLQVPDTGSGTPSEAAPRVFETFSATKEPDRSTRMSLSTVYELVKQIGGSITVHSSPGLGTTFRVLFPAVTDKRMADMPAGSAESHAGDETILVVEDEEGARDYVRQALESHGYRTLHAATGAGALDVARNFEGSVDLLLTDVALPGMNGAEVVRRFQSLRPRVPVLRMSGYPERFGARGISPALYLQKPFTHAVLLSRIRKMLDGAIQ